jgi:uncharacterized protein YecE (DUF72 family)
LDWTGSGYQREVPVFVGTSGWQYKDWRGRFYPKGLAQAGWLEHYAARFQTVEVNNAFYRLPEISTFERWRDTTPDDFVVGIKASRYLTHIKRLKDPTEPVQRLMDRAGHLGPKLGPVLLQLPGNFKVDLGALRETLEAFPSGVRVAFEPRHDSWYVEATADLLAEHDAAFCLRDGPHGSDGASSSGGRARKAPLWRTARWGYVRFHEGRARPHPCYGTTALRTWAERLAERWESSDDIYAYFNNDHGGCAVRDAHRFALALERAGLEPTRVPSAREASLQLSADAGGDGG